MGGTSVAVTLRCEGIVLQGGHFEAHIDSSSEFSYPVAACMTMNGKQLKTKDRIRQSLHLTRIFRR